MQQIFIDIIVNRLETLYANDVIIHYYADLVHVRRNIPEGLIYCIELTTDPIKRNNFIDNWASDTIRQLCIDEIKLLKKKLELLEKTLSSKNDSNIIIDLGKRFVSLTAGVAAFFSGNLMFCVGAYFLIRGLSGF